MSRYLRGGFFYVLLMAGIPTVYAQQYGNEWIDYNKSYYKITLAEDGIYRLSYQDILDAGIPVNAIDAKKYMLFHRGVEQALFIENTGASQLEPGEFIEFYGQRNDGTLDSLLYNPSSSQPHKYYNLYSDSSSYFLTWESGTQNGKRMTFFQEANINGIQAETSHNEEHLELHTSNFRLRYHDHGEFIALSEFEDGDVWTGSWIQEGKFEDFVIGGLSNPFISGNKPVLEMLVKGKGLLNHEFNIYVGPGVSSLRLLKAYSFSDFDTYKIKDTLQWSDISAIGELTIKIEVISNGGLKSNIAPSYFKITFSQQWDMSSVPMKKFYAGINPGGKSYIEIINTPTDSRFYDITDPDNVSIIGYSGGPNEIKAIVPDTSAPRILFVTTSTPVVSTPFINNVSFRNVDPSQHDYIIISHPMLMQPAGQSDNAVKAYAAYRASAAGGGHDTLAVSILDLYNQYSYGETTPLAIYNFMRRMVEQGSPEYLFLIGKALDIRYAYHRSDPGTFLFHDLVPTGGSPGSDAVFTAGLNGSGNEAAVATGRITASTPDDVINYLNKVIEKESLPYNNLWQKKLLHLSGGTSALEKVQFENIVNGFASIAEDIYLGGDVSTVTKNTTNTVEFINVADKVNEGLLFITFFGHSAPGITDIDIGFVTNPSLGYNNPGKYPIFIVNGCQAGDFFENYLNWGADWILAKDVGAVGFIAHVSFGFVNFLKLYSDKFYQTGFADSLFISRPVGVIQNEAAKRYQEVTPDIPVNITQVQQMVLNGDPAVRLFGTNLPDYETRDDNIFTIAPGSGVINNATKEFELAIIAKNFGAATDDSITVAITRTFSDGSIFTYDTLNFAGIFHEDTLIFEINNDFSNNAGLNRFEIVLNADGSIPELDLTNNTGILNLMIPLNGTVNLLPLNYAIVAGQPVRLLAQAATLLTGVRTFMFEIDTVQDFTSSFRKSAMLDGKELAEWNVSIPETDSAVYYWRTKYTQPLPGEEDEWEVSSFTYISSSPAGWAQIKFSQFSGAELTGIIADTITGKWEFEENQTSVFIQTYGANHPEFDYQDVDVEIDGQNFIFAGRLCRDNTINTIAFDKSTAVPYAALFEGVFSPRTCGRQIQVINNYTESEILGAGNYLVNYIDAVKLKDHIVLFSIGQVNYSAWTSEIFNKLGEIGVAAADIQALADGEPMIIFGRKGDPPGDARIITSVSSPKNEQAIQFSELVPGKFSNGEVTGTPVGPAVAWTTLFTNVTTDDATDQYTFNVYGIKNNGSESLLLTGLSGSVEDVSSIDPSVFPKIRLKGMFSDEQNLTVPQLKKWMVIYSSPPEGVLVFTDEDVRIALQEGDTTLTGFAFLNVSDRDFTDSLDVQYSVFNLDSRTKEDFSFRIEPVFAGDTTNFDTPLNSFGKSGLNDLNVVVNPGILPEQDYNNNVIQLLGYMTVEKDNINPLVEVTIDGEHIFDGDIVSPSPFISIRVRDANPFLLLQDTTVTDIFLKAPCEGCILKRIPYSDPAVIWEASEENNKPFIIEYNPQNLGNGIYLLEVQARDATGNKAGDEPFRIHFEVINESTITNFYPYPNPFSSSTRFVFTLTGNEIPDEIKIQIMTISGRIVREITQDELGPVRIGNNISEFAWDGRDEYGDQLANGVYLYRVIVRINGQDVDMRMSGGDKAFKNGFGKIYLLR
ncbi:MAG: hypothetical protein IIB82_02600 [Bacteroidetes bacterium]|nr:hypothetical protein [Bacteroidota bacterium]